MLTSDGNKDKSDDSDDTEDTSGESEYVIEFRSTKDDAWHPVALYTMETTLLVLFIEGMASGEREVFGPDNFETPDQLDHFRTRFRLLSRPVSGVDCADVREGMAVCVIHNFSSDYWGLYDGVVIEVKRMKHTVLDNGDEGCECDFLVSWKHGPLVGTITSTRLDEIHLLAPENETDPALSDFIDRVRQHFHQPWKKRLRFTHSQARRGNDDDGPVSSRGQAPSALGEIPSVWETGNAWGLPEMAAGDKETTPFDPSPFLRSMFGINGNGEMAIEFRSRKDDAWHGVTIRLMLTGKLSLLYDDYTMSGKEEIHEPDGFDTLGEIEDFRERFRPLSSHLDPEECQQVKVGDRVCACFKFEETDQSRFYDSVVKEIARYQHAVIDGKEMCLCSFEIFWKHGPLGGTISSINIDNICVIDSTFLTHPTLSLFLDSSRRELSKRQWKYKHRRNDEQNPSLPNVDADRGAQSGGESSKRDKGKNIVFKH